jgi:hypothetical protein
MMKLRFIFMVAILLGFLSCNLSGNKFDMIESKGLDDDNLGLKTIMFYNKDTGFIAGSSDKVTHNPDFPEKDSNQFAFVNRKALLYKTTDGGNTWTKNDFGEGYFTDIKRIEDIIFAFKTSEDRSRIFVYSSNDLGGTWEERVSFPTNVYNLFFVNNLFWAICSDGKTGSLIYISRDSGKSWTKSVAPLSLYDAIVKEKKVFYLSSNIKDDYRKNLLVEYNMSDSTNKIIELPKEFDCYFLTNYNNEIKLSGLKDGHLAVYSLDKDNQVKYEYSYLKESTYFPQGYYNNKGEEWIIAGKRGDADVSNKILKTRDNGKSWEVISFEKEKYIKPFYFLNDNDKVKAWFYAGSGKFQVME